MVSEALRVIVAEWLRAGMQERNLKQLPLARVSGVSRDTIWRILHAKTDASEGSLRKLSLALGHPLPELSGVTPHGATIPPEPPRSPGEARSGAGEGPRPERAADRAAQRVLEEAIQAMTGRATVSKEEALGWVLRAVEARKAKPG